MPPAFIETVVVKTHEFEPVASEFGDPAYPLPRLKRSGPLADREIRVVVLQNDFLIARFAPDLGGRLLSLVHRESGTGMFPEIPRSADGIRGDTYEWGLEFVIGSECKNSLGPVDHQLLEDDGFDGVVFSDIEAGAGLSWHLFWTLAEGSARLEFEARVVNRLLESNPYDAGLVVPTTFVAHGSCLWDAESSLGVAVGTDPGVLIGDGNGFLRGQTLLAPLQTDMFSGWIAPLVGFEGPPHVGSNIAFEVAEERLKVVSVSRELSGKVVALTADPQPLEAPLNLPSGAIRTLTLPVGTSDFRVLIEGLDESERYDSENTIEVDPEPFAYSLYPIIESGDVYAVNRLSRSASARAAAETAKAILALRGADYSQALDAIESALLFAGDHPLLWWLRAMSNRLSGQVEDRPELLNAHFLAPLEPLLRAEAFLSLDQPQGKDPHPLVAPLADHPEAMVEVACWLSLCQNYADLFRWVDECLRHKEAGRLRILLASAYLKSDQEFEASNQTWQVGEPRPPYLWQNEERRALRSLLARWPDSTNLQTFAQRSGETTGV